MERHYWALCVFLFLFASKFLAEPSTLRAKKPDLFYQGVAPNQA